MAHITWTEKSHPNAWQHWAEGTTTDNLLGVGLIEDEDLTVEIWQVGIGTRTWDVANMDDEYRMAHVWTYRFVRGGVHEIVWDVKDRLVAA